MQLLFSDIFGYGLIFMDGVDWETGKTGKWRNGNGFRVFQLKLYFGMDSYDFDVWMTWKRSDFYFMGEALASPAFLMSCHDLRI